MSHFLVKGDTENPTDDYEDIEAMLREFYAEERDCEWLDEAVRRAKRISSNGCGVGNRPDSARQTTADEP